MTARGFDVLVGVAAPLLRPNLDTDAIIPSREMRGVSKTGLADGLFAGLRYLDVDRRAPDPAFVLNDPAYHGAQILLGGPNFGCGSSREHAAWALAEYGFRVVIAPSFSPIFHGNCISNGLVPVVCATAQVEALAVWVATDPQTRRVTVDLPAQTVTGATGLAIRFEIAQEAKAMLLGGLDAIDLTLQRRAQIDAFRLADAARRPWVYLAADPRQAVAAGTQKP